MMRGRLLTILVLLLLCKLAVYSNSRTDIAISPGQQETTGSAPASKAVLYIFMKSPSYTTTYLSPSIEVDGRDAGGLYDNTYFKLSVAPGKHTVKGTIGRRVSNVVLDIASGETHYLRISPKFSRLELIEVSKEEASPAISKGVYIESGLTAGVASPTCVLLRAEAEAPSAAGNLQAPTPASGSAGPKLTNEVSQASGDIVDLLEQKKIEVQNLGDGIQHLVVRLHRLVATPIEVRIPVGTYFISPSHSVQDMITTRTATVQLSDDRWQNATVSVACANRMLPEPGSGDTFTVARASKREELDRLMPLLAAAEASDPVRQAAVWIVTDNANYSDLGELKSRSSRLIDEDAAARAILLCECAGIKITQKAIWGDHIAIWQRVTDPRLKAWLTRP